MPRFAANLGYLFTEHDFLDRFAAARRAGFAAVEFASPYAYPPEEIAMRLIDNGLACILINLPMGDRSKGDFGIACRPGREAEFRDSIDRGISYARALGVPKVNCISGTIAAGEDPARLRDTLVSNLRVAVREFRSAGLELVLEPINNVDVPGFFVPRCGEAIDVIRAVGADNFGLQCDLYHAAMMGEDPGATFERFFADVRHVQFADAPGRGEPGTGKIDFPPIFALIDRLGYPGWVSAEYRPSRPTAETVGTFLPGASAKS
jgi:hydroxypyruvate isomerase